jgi:hypothetical protein
MSANQIMTTNIKTDIKAIKRLEIITSSVELKKVLETLEKLGVQGYSIIRGVSGKGDRGITTCDLDVDGVCNDYILAICDLDQEASVMKAMHPILTRYGGLCISSDATSLVHKGPGW